MYIDIYRFTHFQGSHFLHGISGVGITRGKEGYSSSAFTVLHTNSQFLFRKSLIHFSPGENSIQVLAGI